jgi:hypothetical protein
MNRNTVTVVAAIVLIAAVGGVMYYRVSKVDSPTNRGSETNTGSKSDSVAVLYDAKIDLSSIENLQGSIDWYRSVAEGQRYHKVDFNHIVEIEDRGEKRHFGFLEKTAGDGTMDAFPSPLFISNGKLFAMQGSTGNPYPLKETNWIYRYKEYNLTSFAVPDKPHFWDQELGEMGRIESGIDNVSIEADKEGNITRVKWSVGETIKDFKAPFKTVAPVNLVTLPEFAGASNYVDYIERTRKLPGRIGGKSTLTMDTGYKLTYPTVLNGIDVTVLKEYQHGYQFSIGDEPTHTEYTAIVCYSNSFNLDQIGPPKGELVPVSPESRSQVADWGYRKEYHGEVYSFLAPGFYCRIHTSGTFRPEMFQFSF